MDTSTILFILAAVVVIYALKRKRDKKKDGGGPSGGKGSVTPILPPYPKGYMSVTKHDGKIYGGTYQLNGRNVVRWPGGEAEVPVRESVYQMVSQGGRLLLACEHAGGKLFRLAGGGVAPVFSGGLDGIISTGQFAGQVCAVSTSYDNGGIKFHNLKTGAVRTLAGNRWHARQILEFRGAYYILAFDYSTETGGWFVSRDLNTWSWRGHLKNVRPLRAVVHGGKMYIACSPFTGGKRHGPATIMSWDGAKVRTEFRSKDGHAMFFGIASDGQNIWAGTLTNWRGSGRANLYRGPKEWKKIWTAPDPEITSIYAEDGVAYVATRNEGGAGRVFKIVGEPGASADPKPDAGRPFAELAPAGGVFKPVSEGDHKLVILFPASWPTPTTVTVNGEPGRLATSPVHPDGRTNGNRPTFRFSKPGKDYGRNVEVVADGKRFTVPNGAVRVG